MPTIAERITAIRHERFVGRADELALFQFALAGEDTSPLLLHVHAPAGVGKTTLLREFERSSGQHFPIWLDGKAILPTTEGFTQAFDRARSIAAEKSVLFVDEFDALAALDGWIRDVFIPGLSSQTVIVLAGRDPLGHRWLTDPAWQALGRSISLRNLNDAEQREFLDSQKIPKEQHDAVAAFTQGHPLALSLVAANLAQNGNVRFEEEVFPDVIRRLLERFVDNVPSPLHRKALEASSLVRVTTEAILARIVDSDRSFELFEWLRNLSFMEVEPGGVSPKTLAREAVSSDLKWRNPELFAEIRDGARRYYSECLERTRGAANQAVVSDYIYLHRDNPAVRPFFNWESGPGAYFDKYSPNDLPDLLEMVTLHEGSEGARLLSHWLKVQPESTVVLRKSGQRPQIQGFLMKLQLEGLKEEDVSADQAANAAWTHLREKAPLRKGETATLFRFWMDREHHQGVSPAQSLLFVAMVQHSLTYPNLAHTFIPCVDPGFWMPMFSYAALVHLDHADFKVGQQQFGMFGHDWRTLTPRVWLELLSEREGSTSATRSETPRLPDVVLLSRESFDAAVHEALRYFNRPSKLSANPLLRSKVLTRRLPAEADRKARLETLRGTILERAKEWNGTGRDVKLYDALDRGYLRPEPSQERAAELLDVSIATFRRHLQAAVVRLCDALWEIEISG